MPHGPKHTYLLPNKVEQMNHNLQTWCVECSHAQYQSIVDAQHVQITEKGC